MLCIATPLTIGGASHGSRSSGYERYDEPGLPNSIIIPSRSVNITPLCNCRKITRLHFRRYEQETLRAKLNGSLPSDPYGDYLFLGSRLSSYQYSNPSFFR